MKRRNKVGEAGANAQREIVNVSDLMVRDVVTIHPETTISEVRELLTRLDISAVPVVDGKNRPVGMVTTADLIDPPADGTAVEELMTEEVVTIPSYSRIHDAARTMRRYHIHHLVVTHEKQVVGILSSFDILNLVAERRFVMKGQGSRPKRGG